jgi:hypothetical protein
MTALWGINAPASSGASFDYYISTTGNDSHAGTLAAPWALTSAGAGSGNNSLMAGGANMGAWDGVVTQIGVNTAVINPYPLPSSG